ncbi:MAG: hypothetical protein L6Q76_38090, partial [Polyangiaceae bacterium]|nr:hypothetical protein [Polyangiaceae bacterium]
ALRVPESHNAVRLEIPPKSDAGVALRIVRPFGDQSAIEQLIVEVRAGASPSPGVVRKTRPSQLALARRAYPNHSRFAFRVALAVALVLAAAFALAGR